MSSNNLESTAQMRGWFKLMETIRKTDPPPQEIMQSPSDSSTTASINTNGYISKSPETSYLDNFSSESPNLMSSPSLIDFVTTPRQIVDDIPLMKIEPTITAAAPKRSSTRHKKITIRKSTRSKTSLTTPDEEISSIDIQYRRQSSIISSVNNSINPIATDLQSLPGHDADETRDQRFLSYSDMNTLTMHLNRCLYIDKKSSSSFSMKPHIFKTRHNILSKIFKLDYLKHSSNVNSKSVFNKQKEEEESKNDRVSSTSISFKTDWSVNRRSSSTHSHDPKNLFHILQLHPKKNVLFSASTQPSTALSTEEQQRQSCEHIKNLLIRTYYPHFHSAVQSGSYFGSSSKIYNKYQDLPVMASLESSENTDETMTITLKSPRSTMPHESKKRGRKPKYKHLKDKPLPLVAAARRVSEEIPAVYIGEPLMISDSPKRMSSPLIEKEMNNNSSTRKRKISITVRSNTSDRRKRPFIASPSPELTTDFADVTCSDNEEDVLPDQLPKLNFINNGLCSNYYKVISNSDSKVPSHKTRQTRRVQQSSSLSGSLPSFYTGIFECDDEKSGHMDYKLPFDIYWFHQKQGTILITPSKPTYQCEEKKLLRTKQKQSSPYKKPTRSVGLPVQESSSDTKEKVMNINRDNLKMEELTEQEKSIVSQTSIFLKRNLRQIREKRELKDKNNNNQHKQILDEQPLPPLFWQNFYHSNDAFNKTDLSHRDLLNLFCNHIRRSHFYKTGQCFSSLVDGTCYYAQLAQLTLILNEMFDLLLNYKCQKSDIYPSNALKKCPLKRLFPMYYELILKPIDLTIIRNKLDNGEYLSFSLFEQDLLLLFANAISYCGEDSDVGLAVRELQVYLTDSLVNEYRSTLDLFRNLHDENPNGGSLNILRDFIKDFHRTEVIHGQIREILYEILFNLDENISPIVYRTIQTNSTNTHRTSKSTPVNDCIIHCRCGSTYDETTLVQCYACQLWQHVTCVVISETSRPYFCFECHPLCEQNPLACLKMNVEIPNSTALGENDATYSTITRSDGLLVRINECYFIRNQDEQIQSSKYDLFFVERLWRDENEIGQASGFYYLRPNETFHEVNRKFFPNEVFRFPSTNDSIEINAIIQPCYVLDALTFCKGKPISEYTSRISPMDLFICEYRVDKLARIFTRLPKSKHIGMNTKSYCFDNYVEKLSIKRDYQPHQAPRRRSTIYPIKLSAKQLEEKSSHIDGLIEKIYCHFHHPNLIPSDTKFSPNQFSQQQQRTTVTLDRNNNRGDKRLRDKPRSSSTVFRKKTRRRSPSSRDHQTECQTDSHQPIVALLLTELIESLSSPLL